MAVTPDPLEDLRKKIEDFDFEKQKSSYESRLGELAQPPRNYNLFDLATDLSRGLTAQQQTDRPDSLAGGLALGFGEASQRMKETQAARQKAKREIGLEAARLAMEDERKAIQYLDEAEYELAVAESGAGKTTADMTNFNFFNSLDPEGQKTWNKMKNQDAETLLLLEGIKRIAGSKGGLDLTLAEEEFDKKFGAKLAEYRASGGASQVASNLSNLSEKISILKGEIRDENGNKYNVSGPILGMLDDAALAIANKTAAGFKSDIRDVVFQSLREKLGAQFTEKEGERLVNAAFNFYLEEEQNIGRLQRLYTSIEDAANEKNAALKYLIDNGTLKGYDYTLSEARLKNTTFDSLFDAVVQESDFDNISDENLEKIIRDSRTDIKERKIAIAVARKRVEASR
jgi:phosphoglycolate phosphatase-like HAD superfamily hydrolase